MHVMYLSLLSVSVTAKKCDYFMTYFCAPISSIVSTVV